MILTYISGDSKPNILGELQLEISLLIIHPLLHTIHLCERSSKLRRFHHEQEHLQHGVTRNHLRHVQSLPAIPFTPEKARDGAEVDLRQ